MPTCASDLLIAEPAPDLPGEKPAFGFSGEKRFVRLKGAVEVPIDVTVAESEIKRKRQSKGIWTT